MQEQQQSFQRRVRSFVLRQGRISDAQRFALQNYWQEFSLEKSDELLDFKAIFGNDNPLTLEIGYGNGDSLAQMAIADPARNFIGIEVHPPGIGNLLKLIKQHDIGNLRLTDVDAVEVLHARVPPQSLDRVQLFFPDPWPKKKHHKRRIVQPGFVSLLAEKIAHGGHFHMATDWEDYALHMAEVMEASTDFVSISHSPYSPKPAVRPLTKFEQRGLKLGHGIWDLIYRRL